MELRNEDGDRDQARTNLHSSFLAAHRDDFQCCAHDFAASYSCDRAQLNSRIIARDSVREFRGAFACHSTNPAIFLQGSAAMPIAQLARLSRLCAEFFAVTQVTLAG